MLCDTFMWCAINNISIYKFDHIVKILANFEASGISPSG